MLILRCCVAGHWSYHCTGGVDCNSQNKAAKHTQWLRWKRQQQIHPWLVELLASNQLDAGLPHSVSQIRQPGAGNAANAVSVCLFVFVCVCVCAACMSTTRDISAAVNEKKWEFCIAVPRLGLSFGLPRREKWYGEEGTYKRFAIFRYWRKEF